MPGLETPSKPTDPSPLKVEVAGEQAGYSRPTSALAPATIDVVYQPPASPLLQQQQQVQQEEEQEEEQDDIEPQESLWYAYVNADTGKCWHMLAYADVCSRMLTYAHGR